MINKCDFDVFSCNIVSDVSDHYSQFCTLHSKTEKFNNKRVRRDFSGFSESSFSDELSQLLNNENMVSPIKDADIAFSKFYNTLNSLVNKHAPLKVFSKSKLKQFSKPWKTSGMRKSTKVQKNSLFISVDTTNYKIYRNKITTLTRYLFWKLRTFTLKHLLIPEE